ncbi:hypothetical protein BU14_2422s0001 [Porphyra umbilicalis]|uniref:Uncharacterized protein n=1 Tax=Porphyra umbilicalis TaxID=2786 RepID=A0A1X6NJC8_PORUM|nr:hypothetical protein BU14_2422s0001 [Porphyra umbilicalis]|eukprot:OSX68660.1 hypothetical protein BU14_2422s0001 [Porphyra umbilicalis]
MAATKALALLLTLVALVSLATATAVPAQGEDVFGSSTLIDAPGLSDIAAVRARKCSSYFPCGWRTATGQAKVSYKCYFKVAASLARPEAAKNGCAPHPYKCRDAKCKGWKQCTCDKCFSAKTKVRVWCEHP